MNAHLQNGWRLLREFDGGVLGAAGLATAPETNFLRLVRVLRQRETYTPLLADERAIAADDVAPAVSHLRRHIVSWRVGQPEVPALKLLEAALPPPKACLDVTAPDAGVRLAPIAALLRQFHQHGISMNLLAPRAIVYGSLAPEAPPVFFDAGIDCRAEPGELEDEALVGRAYDARDVGFWAPEQVRRLAERRPATFQPASDVYFLAAAWITYACGHDVFEGCTVQDVLADGPHILAQAAQALRVPAQAQALLCDAVQQAPESRPAVRHLEPLATLGIRPVARGSGRVLVGGFAAGMQTAVRRTWARTRAKVTSASHALRRLVPGRGAQTTTIEEPQAGIDDVATQGDADATRRLRRAAAALALILGVLAGFAISAEARHAAEPTGNDPAVVPSPDAAAPIRRYARAWRLANAAIHAAEDEAARHDVSKRLEEFDKALVPAEEDAPVPTSWMGHDDVEARTGALLTLARARAGLGDRSSLLREAIAQSPDVTHTLTASERALVSAHAPDELPAALPYAARPGATDAQ